MNKPQVPPVPVLTLLAVFLTGTAGVMVTGVKPILVAAYISAMHLTETQAGLLVGLDMAGATLGTFLVSWRLYKWRRSRVAAAGLAILGAGNLLSIVLGGFTLAAGCFMFSWIAFFPYLMGLCSSFDTVGRLGALSLAVQNIGFATGPALAGMLVEHAGYHSLLTAALLGYILAGTALLAASCRAKRLASVDANHGSR